MQENTKESTIKSLNNLYPQENDSPFAKKVVSFLLKHYDKDSLSITSEKHTDQLRRMGIIMRYLATNRITHDDASLRNACIAAAKDMQQIMWLFSSFKQDLMDLIASHTPINTWPNFSAFNQVVREKINLLEGLAASETITQRLTENNSQLKGKCVVMEEDLTTVKKLLETETNLTIQLTAEIASLKAAIAVKNAKINTLEAENMAQIHKQAKHIEALREQLHCEYQYKLMKLTQEDKSSNAPAPNQPTTFLSSLGKAVNQANMNLNYGMK